MEWHLDTELLLCWLETRVEIKLVFLLFFYLLYANYFILLLIVTLLCLFIFSLYEDKSDMRSFRCICILFFCPFQVMLISFMCIIQKDYFIVSLSGSHGIFFYVFISYILCTLVFLMKSHT